MSTFNLVLINCYMGYLVARNGFLMLKNSYNDVNYNKKMIFVVF